MNQDIFDHLYRLTTEFPQASADQFSAKSIGESLKLNRSTVSSYLNQGHRSGDLIKIKQYPVLFFCKQALVDQNVTVKKTEYNSLEELFAAHPKANALEEVIGANGSLKEAIDQIKTAVLYPHNGLPILLIGASGSGKTFLASKIYDFSVEQQAISENAPFITYNCAQYFSNPELLSSVLFGYTKGAFTGADEARVGLIEKADGGVLFLDEVHRLSEEGQEKLFTFMDSGEFSPVGDNSIKRKANVRLVFATTENIYSAFLPTFLRRLPVIVNLPKFQNRSLNERLQLIDSFFVGESIILNKELLVSTAVLEFLLMADLEGNVGKIKNIIKYACASAYAHQPEQTEVAVRLMDLPREYMLKFKDQFKRPKKTFTERRYLPQTEKQFFLESREEQLLKELYASLSANFKKVQQKELGIDAFIEKTEKEVVLLMDEFIFRESYEKDESLYSLLTYQLRQTFEYMHETYGFSHDGNLVVALANYLYVKGNRSVMEENLEWQRERDGLMDFLADYLDTPYWYAKQLLTNLAQQLDQEVSPDDVLIVTLYFHSLELSSVMSEIKGLVLAHGYSTASSLANVANRMLKKNVFQAYDMPLDITLEKIESHLVRFLHDHRTEAGLVLLVDMGSLNQLGERLEKRLKGPLLIIDHVSTPLILEVGQQIIDGNSLADIDTAIEDNLQIRKQLVYPQLEKKKAILTCCYTGIGSATQIQEILQKCLGDTTKECTIIPYDYKKLAQNKNYETPFQMYEVLMIVGTEDPKINHIPYIGLDQLINGEKMTDFVTILRQHFAIEGDSIEDELIFNFSINKIVENITILDANKLLRFVQRAVAQVEQLLEMDFTNNQLFLLYLHCSCMVERILRKESVDDQLDIEEYLQTHSYQMDAIHRGFKELESEYNIEVPDLELRLINDIIGD